MGASDILCSAFSLKPLQAFAGRNLRPAAKHHRRPCKAGTSKAFRNLMLHLHGPTLLQR